jgi:hypothetical protein
MKVPDGLSDEQVLFLSDIFPTGHMAADFCNFKGGETVAILGAGPVGQFATAARGCLARSASSRTDCDPVCKDLTERDAIAQVLRPGGWAIASLLYLAHAYNGDPRSAKADQRWRMIFDLVASDGRCNTQSTLR